MGRWRDQVPEAVRFYFEFPRTITHDRLLIDGADEVRTLLDRVLPLGEQLGTPVLQLPPRFGPPQLGQRARFLAARRAVLRARWLTACHTPYVFIHSPDDIDAPANAYQVHARLRALVDVGELPPWPGTPRQLGLF